MARALMGHVGSSNDTLLAYEVARLRRRIVELETELEAVREQHSATIDLELHRLAEAPEPALA